jgi:uncharacterized protein (TIGR03067 family)
MALQIANARLWQDEGEQKEEPSSVTTVPVMGRNSTDDTAASGLDELQGTWVGNVLGAEQMGEVSWTFSGSSFHFVLVGPQVWIKGTFIVNEEPVPKQADLTITESFPADDVGKTAKCIYGLKNDSLILACSPPGDETRPSDFEPSDDGLVFQLKRQPTNEDKE